MISRGEQNGCKRVYSITLAMFGKEKAIDRVTFLLPLITAVIVYSINLTGDLFGDEFATYRFSVLQNPEFLDPERASTSMLFLWLSKLGHWLVDEPWGIRIPALIWGVGTVLMVGLLAKQILGREYQKIAMWVAATSPLLVEFSAEGRPYTIMAFWGTAFLCILVMFVRSESWRSSFLLGAVSAAGVLSKTIFAVNLFFGALYYFAVKRAVTAKASVAVLLSLPVLVYAAYLLFFYGDQAPKVPERSVGV